MSTSDEQDKLIQQQIAAALRGGGGGAAAGGSLSSNSPMYVGALGGATSALQLPELRAPFLPQPGVGKGVYKATEEPVPYGAARLAPRDWTAAQTKQFINSGILNKMPGFDVNMGLPEVMNAWDGLLQQSYLLNQGLGADQKKWSPEDIMHTYSNNSGKFGTVKKGDWIFDVATGERIKYVGKTSKTVTSKKLDLSSPEDAHVLVNQVLHQALGRNATSDELARFKASINGFEKANPEVTTTTQQLSPDLATGDLNVTSESSTSSGGVSDAARAALVNAPITKTKEYGKYQAATTYWGAMMQMIGGG